MWSTSPPRHNTHAFHYSQPMLSEALEEPHALRVLLYLCSPLNKRYLSGAALALLQPPRRTVRGSSGKMVTDVDGDEVRDAGPDGVCGSITRHAMFDNTVCCCVTTLIRLLSAAASCHFLICQACACAFCAMYHPAHACGAALFSNDSVHSCFAPHFYSFSRHRRRSWLRR